jgi:hypothetical protein
MTQEEDDSDGDASIGSYSDGHDSLEFHDGLEDLLIEDSSDSGSDFSVPLYSEHQAPHFQEGVQDTSSSLDNSDSI